MRRAEQFADAAETIRDFADDEADVGDAYVTLLIHAGIAAADVICCEALGEHAQSESHTAAVELLRRVRPDAMISGTRWRFCSARKRARATTTSR